MADVPQFGLLVMDDGGAFGDIACNRAGIISRSSVRLALEGAPVRHSIRTAAIVPQEQFTLKTAVETAAAEGLLWILAPRRLEDALSTIVDATTGAAKVLGDANQGFAIGFFDPTFPSTSRIGAVADLRDPVTTGLSAWAAVGLAVRLRADLDVLVLGTRDHEEPPATPQEAMERFEIQGAGWQTTMDAVDRAVSHGIRLRWVPLGAPSNRSGAILDAIDERGYGIVIDDLPAINVGPKLGRRRRVQAALTQAGSSATAYRLLRDAPCGVVVVLDAVRMGLVPDQLLKSGVAAALAFGVMGASTAAAAATGVPTATAMPEPFTAAEAAVAEVAEPALDLSTMTADDLATMRQDLALSTAARDATAAELATVQEQHAQNAGLLAYAQQQQAALEAELEPLQEAADEAAARGARLGRATIGPLSLLPFTPTQAEADRARADAERTAADLAAVQEQADTWQANADELDAERLRLEEQAAAAQQTLAVQQAQVDLLGQQTADLAWALNPVVIPVQGEGWFISAWFGERGPYWSGGWHKGLDFAGPTGLPIVAAKSGVVIEAGWGGAFGNNVVVQHPDGTTTRYAHLNSITVSVGQEVGIGEKVGTLGSTGNSTGPHLHFEVVDPAGNIIDPAVWLGLV